MFVENIMRESGVNHVGGFRYPSDGRIVKNIIASTKEYGEILFRVRSSHEDDDLVTLGYTVKKIVFEVKVLKFLEKNYFPAPRVDCLLFSSDGLIKSRDFIAYAYPLIPGYTLDADDMNVEEVSFVSMFFNKFFFLASRFPEENSHPQGDLQYIEAIVCSYAREVDWSKNAKSVHKLLVELKNSTFIEQLEQTPKGLVHGDLFWENIVCMANGTLSLIDFGDAYYGYIIMDLSTASMEFAFQKNKLDEDRYKAFLREVSPWLSQNKINFDVYFFCLQLNCLRFIVHTAFLSERMGENTSINTNVYMERYLLITGELNATMRKCYDDAVI